MCDCSNCAGITTPTGQKGDKGDTGPAGGFTGILATGVATTSPIALTKAQSSTTTFLRTGASVITLPVAPAAGNYYDFIVENAGAYSVRSVDATFFIGYVVAKVAATPDVIYSANSAVNVSIVMNGTTTGGLVGTNFRLLFDGTYWNISGQTAASGVTVTPFV